ncbi:MAG: S1-like domain-containing RNA-binding protein [Opitutae bacterium]
MALLGKRNLLPIVRSAQPGFYLDGGAHGEILLPGRYIPPGATPGGKIDVFVYRDSEDRLVATTQKPLAAVGEFACLQVVAVSPRIGVFLNWGLEKDLLLPIREMDGPLNPGDWVVVQVALDEQTDRLVASARLNRRLDLTPANYHEGEAVKLLVASKSPLGYNLIVNNAHWGLIYDSDLTAPLKVGQLLAGYVRSVRPDGKLDLALGQAGYRRIGPYTEQIMAILQAKGGHLPYHDNSLPEEIRDVFGMSKKAFKQAIGSLFRERRIVIEPDGIRLAVATGDRPTPRSP